MKNILVKSSGDLTDGQEFYNFVADKALQNRVVVICGGGTKISAALEAAGYDVEFDKLERRVTATVAEKIIMRDVLAGEAKNLQKKFLHWNVIVVPPILYLAQSRVQSTATIWSRRTNSALTKFTSSPKKTGRKKRKKFLKISPKSKLLVWVILKSILMFYWKYSLKN